jgi:hypothetical protein
LTGKNVFVAITHKYHAGCRDILSFEHPAARPGASYPFTVASHLSQKMAGVLRDTLRRVELSADMSPNDPALLELKRLLLLKIAALEAEAAPARAGADSLPGVDSLHRPPQAA